MGGMAIVVVGDDWRDQPDRYQSLEHAEASNRHIVTVDRLPAALKAYPWATKSRIRLPDGREVDNFDEIESAQMGSPVRVCFVHYPLDGEVPFPEWGRKQFGTQPLALGAEPDLVQEHRFGGRGRSGLASCGAPAPDTLRVPQPAGSDQRWPMTPCPPRRACSRAPSSTAPAPT